MMKQEPISCRADNALAARCQSFVARWACVLNRSIFYLAAYIDNNVWYTFCMISSFQFCKTVNSSLVNIFCYSCHLSAYWCITTILRKYLLIFPGKVLTKKCWLLVRKFKGNFKKVCSWWRIVDCFFLSFRNYVWVI